jgi:hypothetical protein
MSIEDLSDTPKPEPLVEAAPPHEEPVVTSPERVEEVKEPSEEVKELGEEVKESPAGVDKAALLAEVESELAQLKAVIARQSYEEATLSASPAFELTIGSRSALSLLRDMSDEKLYFNSQPSCEVIWAFRIFHQFRGMSLPSSESEAWTYCRRYLVKARPDLGER